MNIILDIILIIFISFLPVLFWAYAFSYLDSESLNRKRFFSGIIWGAISVVPILYMDKIIDYIKLSYLNIFDYIKSVNGLLSGLQFSLSLEIFLFFLALVSIIGSLFILSFKINLKTYLKNIFVFFIFSFFIVLVVYLLNLLSLKFGFLNSEIDSSLEFKTIVFNSVKLVIFYYILVAFIEEASKHFNFLSSSLFKIETLKTWVLYAIFIALWFAMLENILYFYNYYSVNWFTWDFVKLYFFRSIFAIITHIFASSIMAYFFTKAYLLYKNNLFNFNYLKIFLIWLSLAILVHLIFDVSLTLGFNLIIIIYLVWGYLYVSSIFFRE